MVKKSVLIMTVSGGSGHLRAAKAIREKLLQQDPTTHVIERNVFLDCLGKPFGRFCTYLWNRAQTTGNVGQLCFLVGLQPFANVLFWLPVFSTTAFWLYRNKSNELIDTQPLNTATIIRAMRFVQFITKRKITYKKILTELPTEETIHFFEPIRRLSTANKNYLTLIAPPPLLKEHESAKAFWQKHAGLAPRAVKHEEDPLSKEIIELRDSDLSRALTIPLHTIDTQEHKLLQELAEKQNIPHQADTTLKVTLRDTDQVLIISLGGYPEQEAIYRYVETILKFYQQHPRIKHTLNAFIFCNRGKTTNVTLQRRITDLIHKYQSTRCRILPIGYQPEITIGTLLKRSDATITRAGGMTSMELLYLCEGRIWIHNAISSPALQKVRYGMPPWEKGNAEYLKAKKNADYITPESSPTKFSDLLEDKS